MPDIFIIFTFVGVCLKKLILWQLLTVIVSLGDTNASCQTLPIVIDPEVSSTHCYMYGLRLVVRMPLAMHHLSTSSLPNDSAYCLAIPAWKQGNCGQCN